MSQDESVLKELQETFMVEVNDLLEETENLFIEFEQNPQDKTIINSIFRIFHTIKGSARAVNFIHLSDFTHIAEDILVKLKGDEISVDDEIMDALLAANDFLKVFIEALNEDINAQVDASAISQRLTAINQRGGGKPARAPTGSEPAAAPATEDVGWALFDDDEPAAPVIPTPAFPVADSPGQKAESKKAGGDDFIRLSMRKLDHFLDSFGEQVILQATLEECRKNLLENEETVQKTIAQLAKITFDLQHAAMALRMVPIKTLFNKVRRTVRDGAKAVGKDIVLETQGEDAELDKVFVDELVGAMTHILRNALDHGIEKPDERKAAGKPDTAVIHVNAYQSCGYFFLDVIDDGRGIDPDKILNKAIKVGLASPDRQYSEEEIYKFLFSSGFSTAEKVTDVSGRGVGMDAVVAAVNHLRGEFKIKSKLGHGTTVTIKLPMSMAIFNGIVFELCGDRYVLPSTDISEIYRFQPQDVTTLDNNESLLRKGEEAIRLVNLEHKIGVRKKSLRGPGRQVAFIIHRDGQDLALRVDEIVGQNRIVQKKLGSELENLPGVAGGAILGDGSVALVLSLDIVTNELKPVGRVS